MLWRLRHIYWFLGLLWVAGWCLHCAKNSPCLEQERACDGDVLLVCVGDGKGWLRFPCSAGDICLDGQCRTGLQPVNDAGPTPENKPARPPQEGDLCVNQAPLCHGSASRLLCWQGRWKREDCPTGKVCRSGSCEQALVCQDGSRRCTDKYTFELCFQGTWQTQRCPSGQQCLYGKCEQEPDCQDGDVRCAEPYVVESCRNGVWERQRCAVGMYCKQGVCAPMNAPCQDGTTRCQDAGNLETCVQGAWQSSPCPAGQRCEQDQCVAPPVCPDGKKRCASVSAQEQCVKGQWQRSNCAAGQQCQVDQCVTLTGGACPSPCSAGQICQYGRCVAWSTQYQTVPFVGNKTDRNPPQHADLNLKLRGWQLISGQSTGLVSYNGPTDPNAPKLPDMFPGKAFPGIVNNYQVGAWDWSKNAKNGWINTTYWKVHMVGFKATPGTILKIPSRKPDIYQGWARVLVLYVDADSITFVYTREDTVANGYAVHINGINIAVDLANLYKQHASRGSKQLPALENDQPFATVIGNEVRVAIRDRGQFMDPRSQKDWW